MEYTTTVTQKGQVTIPVEFREKLKLSQGDKVRFEKAQGVRDALILEPVPDFASLRGTFQTKKKFSKKKAREAYLKEVIAGKV